GQAVDRAEEGGEGLARARRCDHQGVIAPLDRLPGCHLRRGRGGEGLREPLLRGRGEGRRELPARLVHPSIVDRGADIPAPRVAADAGGPPSPGIGPGTSLSLHAPSWQDGWHGRSRIGWACVTTTKG